MGGARVQIFLKSLAKFFSEPSWVQRGCPIQLKISKDFEVRVLNFEYSNLYSLA